MPDQTDPPPERPRISLPGGKPAGKSGKYKKRRGPPPLVIRKERAPRDEASSGGGSSDASNRRDGSGGARAFGGKPHGPGGERRGGSKGWQSRPPRTDRPRDDRPREGRFDRDKPRGFRDDRAPRPQGWKSRSDRDDKGGDRRRTDKPWGGDKRREGRSDRDKPRGPRPDDWKPRNDGWQPRPPRESDRKAAGAAHAGAEAASGMPPSSRPPGVDKLQRICGLNAVQSLHAATPERIVRLFYTDEQRHLVGAIAKSLATAHKPYRQVEAEELARIAGTVLHGGVVALAEPKPVPPLDLAVARDWAVAGEPLLILDGVGNPHNVGAIARTAAYFGVRRIVLSAHPTQAGLSDAAYRVAQGGLDNIETYRTGDLAAALAELKGAYHVVGTALAGATPLAELARDARPLALVLGNEEEGVPATTLAACESIVRIPGAGRVQSLNVAATAAILVHALLARAE